MESKRRIVEALLIYSVLQMKTVSEELFEVAVEGNQVDIKCKTNSTDGVDWGFLNVNNKSSWLSIYRDSVVPDKFRNHYSVEKDGNDSFVLSVKDISSSDAGMFKCYEGGSQSAISTTNLTVITSIVCSSNANNFTVGNDYIQSHCSFSINGSISLNRTSKQEMCANDRLWQCDDFDGKISCNITMNVRDEYINRTIPVKVSDATRNWNQCNMSCLSGDNRTTDDMRTDYFVGSIHFEVRLQCLKNSLVVSTSADSVEKQESFNHVHILIVVGASISPIVITIIFAIIFTIVRRLKRESATKEAVASEFGTMMAAKNLEEKDIYHEIEDIPVVDYYNTRPEAQTSQAPFYHVLHSSNPKSQENQENDISEDDGYLHTASNNQIYDGIHSDCKLEPIETE